MPYKVIGKQVLHQKGGVWKVKQTCKSSDAAKRAMKLLYGLETGSIKKSSKKSSKRSSKKGGKK